jgi:hypothetical protein
MAQQYQVFPRDPSGFLQAAGNPPIAIDFDSTPAGTDLSSTSLGGVTFYAYDAPLIVAAGLSTYTPPGFLDVVDPDSNRLFPTSGTQVLTPGGVELAPGPNDPKEKDDLRIVFDEPVRAVGFDHLSQSADGFGFTSVRVYDESFAQIYFAYIQISNLGQAGPGTDDFWGIVSDQANIKILRIEETDNNNQYPDCNIGLDSIRFFRDSLELQVSPQTVAQGDSLTLQLGEGNPGELHMLTVVDISGTPTFQSVLLGAFGSNGWWSLAGAVPAGFSGLDVTFQSLGFSRSGALVASNARIVSFQ